MKNTRVLPIVALLTAAALSASAAIDPNFVEVDETAIGSHGDLAFPYIDGAWDIHVHTGFYCDTCTFENFLPNQALIIANEKTYTARLPDSPGFAEFGFIGVDEGEYFWQMEQSSRPDELFLGWRVERGFDGVSQVAPPDPNNWTAWDPDGPGPDQTSFWMQIRVLDVRGPGHFSVWQTGPFGDVRAFVASSDGLDDSDAFRSTVGSHVHSHMGFTRAGRYEIDLQARTFGAAGVELLSPITTFYFEARPPSCANNCGDLDGSTTIDLADFALLQSCQGQPLNASAACACANLDGDSFIAFNDFERLAMRWGGPSLLWPCP